MSPRRAAILPPSLAPIGIDRIEAAAYVGVGESLFDRLVDQGLMPQPRMLAGRLVWDVEELAKAFRSLPHRAESIDQGSNAANPWD